MMKNRSITLLLLAGCLTLAPLSAHAGIFDFLKRKKKPAKTEKPVEKTPLRAYPYLWENCLR